MKAYSQDLRQRVLRAIDSGESQIETAEAFAVSVPTIKRYLRQRRETGHVLPKGIEGASCQKRSGVAGPLESAMRGPSRRDARRALLPVPSRTWHRREQMKQLLSQDLVFVDETGSHIAMTPLYAYAPRGQRALGKVPRNYGAMMTLIASLSTQGMGEAFLLDGAADGAAFEIYVEQLLAPSLRPGQLVILDHLSIHQGPRVKQALEAKGCRLLFLPAYSPDFSPLEEAFSKVKTFLRRPGARTREAGHSAIAQVLLLITAQDALGWFAHCGYPPPLSSERDQSFCTPL